MVSYPYNEKIQLNGTKIKGELVVQEWINGIVQSEPATNPKLIIKDINGSIVEETTMQKIMPYLYRYEIDITKITEGESYTIEVIGTNPNNISDHQEVEVIYNNQEIGKINDNKIIIEENKIRVENNNFEEKLVEINSNEQ